MVGAGLGVCVACTLASACLPVAEVPLVVGDVLSSRDLACKLGGTPLANGGSIKAHGWQRTDSDGLSNFTGAKAITATYSEGHLIGAWTGVGVRRAIHGRGLPVAKVPLVAVDLLSWGIGRTVAGELCGFAYANIGKGEVGGGLRIDDDLSGGRGSLVADGGDAGVCAGHVQSAVRTGGVLE